MAASFTFNKEGHYYELDGKRLHGVTTVLGVIAKPMLIGWAAKQTAEWIRENATTYHEQPLGNEIKHGWVVWESDLQEAVKAHTKKKEAGGAKGTDLHSIVEGYVKNCIVAGGHAFPIMLGQDTNPGFHQFVKWACDNSVQFLASEKRVYNDDPDLWYAGTADFTCIIKGKRLVGDLKTMKKLWDRQPFLQTAAYLMALERMGEDKFDGSVIVNINKETNELTEHYSYDWEGDGKGFLAALTLYKTLSAF